MEVYTVENTKNCKFSHLISVVIINIINKKGKVENVFSKSGKRSLVWIKGDKNGFGGQIQKLKILILKMENEGNI